MRSFHLIALALFALGCAQDPEGEVTPSDLPVQPSALASRAFATGSTTVVTDRGFAWNVNTDSGTISRTKLNDDSTAEFPVGEEPTRIAVQGDRVFVTLRGERALAVFDATAPERGVIQLVHVGAEPYGVVVREDGLRVYVALSQEDAVVELDGATLEPVRRFEIAGEPRYLALHPSGSTLFVGSGRGEARISSVNVHTGAVALVGLPGTRRLSTEGDIPLVPRITGDLRISPDGDKLLAPVLYADNVTPIRDVEEVPSEPGMPVEVPIEGGEGYGGAGDGVDKFTPAVVEVPVSPTGQATDSEGRAVFVSMSVFAPNSATGVLTLGSYLSSVTPMPDSQRWVVTMQASSVALLVDPDAPVFSGAFAFDGAADPAFGNPGGTGNTLFTMPEDGGFAPVALAAMVVGSGADGAAWDAAGHLVVNSAFDGSLDRPQVGQGESMLQVSIDSQFNMPEFASRGMRVPVSASPLSAQIREGRDLFFSARDASMGTGGISCSTCHFEGRNDGITWTFQSGVRQTPSLAGVVSETAPVTWTSDVASVAMEADITSRGRMGGTGLAPSELEAIAAYVDWSREVDVPLKGASSMAVARGQEIFQRADVGCASCHSGERYTDNTGHTIRGIENLNTPGLEGIAATGPYLHDGSAPNLRSVLEWARSGVMGDTSSLSTAEMDDLEAYLRSL